MKKFYCYLGLFGSGIVINLLFAYLFLIFTCLTFPLSILLDIIILIFISMKIVSIIKLFKQNINIGTPTFIILTQLPIAILSTVSFLYVKFSRYSLCIWNDPIFGYEIEYLFPLATSISSTIILYLTVIICLISYIKRKITKKRNSEGKREVWKKFLCNLGLIIGGIAVPLAFAYFTTFFTFIIFPISLLLDIVLLICFVICMTYILKLLINKAKINVKKIILYFEVPCVILSVLSFILVKYWINNNYFGDGMLAGLAEYIFSILLLICSLSTIVITIILCRQYNHKQS